MIRAGSKESCLRKIEFSNQDQMTGYLDASLDILGDTSEDAKNFASQFLRPFSERSTFKEALLQPNALVQAAKAMTRGICKFFIKIIMLLRLRIR